MEQGFQVTLGRVLVSSESQADKIAARPPVHDVSDVQPLAIRRSASVPLDRSRVVALLLEVILELALPLGKSQIVSLALAEDGKQSFQFVRADSGASHFDAHDRPGLDFNRELLGILLEIGTSRLDVDRRLEPLAFHIEPVDPQQSPFNFGGGQLTARSPARDGGQSRRRDSGVAVELHSTQPSRWSRIDRKKNVSFLVIQLQHFRSNLGMVISVFGEYSLQAFARRGQFFIGERLAQTQTRGTGQDAWRNRLGSSLDSDGPHKERPLRDKDEHYSRFFFLHVGPQFPKATCGVEVLDALCDLGAVEGLSFPLRDLPREFRDLHSGIRFQPDLHHRPAPRLQIRWNERRRPRQVSQGHSETDQSRNRAGKKSDEGTVPPTKRSAGTA